MCLRNSRPLALANGGDQSAVALFGLAVSEKFRFHVRIRRYVYNATPMAYSGRDGETGAGVRVSPHKLSALRLTLARAVGADILANP